MNAAIIAKSVKALAMTAGGLVATANLALAAAPAPTAPAPIVATETYSVTYTCTGGPGCAMGTGYKHTYTISVDAHGLLKGTGFQDSYPAVTEALAGSVAFNSATRKLSMNFVSTYTGYLAGYTVTETGSVDLVSGALTGTATSGMPGNTDGTFSVSGTRTNLTMVRGTGDGDNEDVNRVNPPIKHDGAGETKVKATKPTVKPTSEAVDQDGQGGDEGKAAHQAHNSD
jgi:hypothetical protein